MSPIRSRLPAARSRVRAARLHTVLVLLPLFAAGRAPAAEAPAVTAVTAVTAVGLAPTIRQQRLADIGSVAAGEVRAQRFELSADQAVRVRATGADMGALRKLGQSESFIERLVARFNGSDDRDRSQAWPANAWILDAETREVVWALRGHGRHETRDGLLTFEGDVELPAGRYEVYYALLSINDFGYRNGWGRFDRSFGVTVEGRGRSLGDVTSGSAGNLSNVIVALRGARDGLSESAGFVLERPTSVDIRGIGEARRGATFDYGWILNTETRERVWQLTYEDSEPAGGDDKNRQSHVQVELPAGSYAAFFVTDDSHSPTRWNAPPPSDPLSYGLTIRLLDPSVRSAVRLFDYEPAPPGRAIVALTGVGNEEYRSAGFKLTRAMGVRIFALGEKGSDGMVDYGWITNTDTGERVWEMAYDRTEHAGGASKNRLFEGAIRLEAGTYIAHYVSDDSHSTAGWNDSAPAEREYWGMTLMPANGVLDPSVVERFDPENDPSVIARIVAVRDNNSARRGFRLERDGGVRIYAIGEGVGGDMADYAWIQDASGRRVWQMRYEDTEHAGGAQKNRVFDGTIRLPAGEYVVGYRTDDSHAFGSWNASRPRDFANWGVTLYRVN